MAAMPIVGKDVHGGTSVLDCSNDAPFGVVEMELPEFLAKQATIAPGIVQGVPCIAPCTLGFGRRRGG